MKSSRIALLDLFSGISGDMLLGALLDLGADLEVIRQDLDSLGLPGLNIHTEKIVKKGISCLKATVEVEEETHPHRHLSHIEAILRGGKLPEDILERSLDVFRRIAEAEAKIHGKPVEKIHFHEVGALDAVVDVTASLLAVRNLGIERFYADSVSIGTGTVDGAHGTLPVPCPAALEILGDFPLEPTGIRQEMVTPTGAALLRHLVKEPGWPARIRVEHTGYGAGTREIPGRANVVRIAMGQEKQGAADLVSVVETNIDDMNPEIYGYLIERLLEQGALDAYLTPLIGKKNRPAVLISALCPVDLENQIAQILLDETTSLGIRTYRCTRTCMHRETKTVQTRWGAVQVKIGHHGERTKIAPEFEDCRRIAQEHGVALLEVYEEVRRIHGLEA